MRFFLLNTFILLTWVALFGAICLFFREKRFHARDAFVEERAKLALGNWKIMDANAFWL